jgi:hypothetical protein
MVLFVGQKYKFEFQILSRLIKCLSSKSYKLLLINKVKAINFLIKWAKFHPMNYNNQANKDKFINAQETKSPCTKGHPQHW